MCNATRIGGSYGARITRNVPFTVATAIAAYKLNKPVRMFMNFNTVRRERIETQNQKQRQTETITDTKEKQRKRYTEPETDTERETDIIETQTERKIATLY